MISVAELKRIADARIEDAKTLLASGRFDGATYLCGYAVEVALKMRICRTLNWPGMRSRDNVIGTSRQADAEAMIKAADQLLAVL